MKIKKLAKNTIGDVSRFDNAAKLVAFIGQDPTIYESGNYTSEYTRMSKQSSKHMRFVVHNISNRIVYSVPKFSAYYHKKRSSPSVVELPFLYI